MPYWLSREKRNKTTTRRSLGHSKREIVKDCDRIVNSIIVNGLLHSPRRANNHHHSKLKELCIRVRELLLKEPAFIKVTPPVFIIGDIHGQLSDLIRMLKRIGTPPKSNCLFLGDYVDRGANGLETISLLLALKLAHPHNVHLLRGNHETRFINKQYGFYDECLRKYGVIEGIEVWTHFQHVFHCLPFAALVAERIFCAHGGISKFLISFSQFDFVNRPCDITTSGLLTDLLWSDPSTHTEMYAPSPRKISLIFGQKAIDHFCTGHNVDMIVRAHQCVRDGFEFFGDRKCITIFSAPAYCGEIDNSAAVLEIKNNCECRCLIFRPRLQPVGSLAKKTPESESSTEKPRLTSPRK